MVKNAKHFDHKIIIKCTFPKLNLNETRNQIELIDPFDSSWFCCFFFLFLILRSPNTELYMQVNANYIQSVHSTKARLSAWFNLGAVQHSELCSCYKVSRVQCLLGLISVGQDVQQA